MLLILGFIAHDLGLTEGMLKDIGSGRLHEPLLVVTVWLITFFCNGVGEWCTHKRRSVAVNEHRRSASVAWVRTVVLHSTSSPSTPPLLC